MTERELLQFYEKLYFHEIEAREKIHAPMQLPLTLLLALLGGVIFLFQNFDFQAGTWSALTVMFLFFFSFGVLGLTVAMLWFVNALYNNTYWFLPDSSTTAAYRSKLEAIYSAWDRRDQLIAQAMDAYLGKYFVEYASFNAQVNDRRSAFIHLCNGAIIGAAVLFIFAYLAFYFGDLDKGRIKAPVEVRITQPVDVRLQERGK